MSGDAVLDNRRALALLGCLSIQRLAAAALPVVLVVVSADVRGYGAAATIQGTRVAVSTVSAPFRARILDRIGRHRVIVPQTLLTSVLLLLLGEAVIVRSVPLPVVLLAVAAPAAASPTTAAVIRTLWRTIGAGDEQQVKALHSYDSILEEVGYLVGPFLAAVLMLTTGHKAALFTSSPARPSGRDVRGRGIGSPFRVQEARRRASITARKPWHSRDALPSQRQIAVNVS